METINLQSRRLFAAIATDFDIYCKFVKRLLASNNDIGLFVKICKRATTILPKNNLVEDLAARANCPMLEKYIINDNGVNIVLYDIAHAELIDSVCFDLVRSQVFRRNNDVAALSSIDVQPLQTTVKNIQSQLIASNKKLNSLFFELQFEDNQQKIDFFKSLPPAAPLLRLYQKLMSYMLYVFVELCDRLGVTYFLDFGALIGAVRTGAFVPWDDDLDVTIPFEGAVSLCEYLDSGNQYNDLPELYARFSRYKRRMGLPQIAMSAVGPAPFVELFPYIFAENRPERSAEIKGFQKQWHTRTIDSLGQDMHCLNAARWAEQSTNYIHECREKFNASNSDDTIVLPFFSNCGPYFYPKESVFPLSKITLEGIEVNAPRDPSKVLRCIYGDYLSLPLDIVSLGHTMIKSDALSICVDVIKKYHPQFFKNHIERELEEYYAESNK